MDWALLYLSSLSSLFSNEYLYSEIYSLFFFPEYPLAVKLGTITQDGNADVYSYDEDDMVLDPNLVKHLAVSSYYFCFYPVNILCIYFCVFFSVDLILFPTSYAFPI